MKTKIFLLIILVVGNISLAKAEEDVNALLLTDTTLSPDQSAIFDDTQLLIGFTEKFSQYPKETLLEMIKDDSLTGMRSAAAVRAFKNKYSDELVLREKRIIEKFLLRRLNRGDTPFVKTEIMETLCRIDRYRYFAPMVLALIQKLDHYNPAINKIAYEALEHITINTQTQRAREARIVFNTIRKILFLSRNRLKNMAKPDERITQKLNLLRWSIKILGTQELKRLPKEVINLM